jgi:hypothetical protein
MKKYIFIDETGSPQFFAKGKRPLWTEPDFVPIICLGMVITKDRMNLRNAVTDFKNQILNDPLVNSIHSVSKPGWYLHARGDHSDINLKMVDFLRGLNCFKFSAVIGRKIPEIFINKHNGNAIEFYFDLIHKLLELDHFSDEASYHLYLSHRQSNTEQRFTEAFKNALKAKSMAVEGISFSCSIVRSCDCPEMSVVDYLLWALQRYILKGERRYFTALEKHYENILDIYDNEGRGKLYGINDSFQLPKASLFHVMA